MSRNHVFRSLPGQYRQTMVDANTGEQLGASTTVTGMDRIWATSSRSDLVGSLREGWNPPKTYVAVFTRHKPLYGTQYSNQYGFPQPRYRIRQGTLSTTIPFGRISGAPNQDPALANECLLEALDRLKDKKINLPVTFAERRQTAALFEDTAKRLATSYRAFRQGRFVEAFSSRRTAAARFSRRQFRRAARNAGLNPREYGDHWLKFTYGVRPMLSDLYGAVEQLHKSEKIRPPLITVKAQRNTVDSTEELLVRPDIYAFLQKVQTSEGCFIRLDYQYPGDFQRDWTELGITNPLDVAWELLPYSFMVDWFLPIGNYLNSLDAALGLTFRGGSVSMRTVIKKTGLGASVPSVPSQRYSGKSNYFRLVRTVYSTSPLPDLPSFHISLTKEKVASGLSILRQSLARR